MIENCSCFLLQDFLLRKHFGFEIGQLIRLSYSQLFGAADLIGIDSSAAVGLIIFVLMKSFENSEKVHFAVAAAEKIEAIFLFEEEDLVFEIAED